MVSLFQLEVFRARPPGGLGGITNDYAPSVASGSAAFSASPPAHAEKQVVSGLAARIASAGFA